MTRFVESLCSRINEVSRIFSVGINREGLYFEVLDELGKLLKIQPVVYTLEKIAPTNGFLYHQGNIFEQQYPLHCLFFLPRPDSYWGVNEMNFDQRSITHSAMLKQRGISYLMLFDIQNTNISNLEIGISKQLGHPDITIYYSQSTGNHMLLDFLH